MGRRTKYHVNLNDKEREYLRKNSSGGAWRPRAVKKALILLKADISQGAPIPDEQIAREINSSISTVRNTKLRFAKGDRYVPKVTIIMDNLNTHTPASLYVRFEPATAKRIADNFDIQHTPKHGSWLNMAEIEFSALSKQCLNRRIASQEKLVQEVAIWEAARNASTVRCDWQFTTDNARIKLRKLYPTIGQKLN